MKLREWKSWLPKFLSKPAPAEKLVAQPLNVNPNPERKLLRHAGRLMRLHSALARGQETPEIHSEIRKLRLFVEAEGYIVTNEAEAVVLYKHLGGV